MSDFYKNKDLIANQFCDAPGFEIWLKEKMRSYDNAADWLLYLQENLDIYTAKGYWLDLIGLIVGQGRTVSGVLAVEFFGFADTPGAVGFGKARFWNGTESLSDSSILADPEYRTALLAKVAFNFADVTLTGISESLSIILNSSNMTVTNDGAANIAINIAKPLTDTEKSLINTIGILPVAAGVSVVLTFDENPT